MPERDTIELHCPGKVNLALSVGAPIATARGSLHPIASWMVAVMFADDLRLTKASSEGSRFDMAFVADAPLPGKIDWPLDKDLCFKAHAAMEARAGRELPVVLALRKRIPTGAGLGGGSSDAAATLVATDALFGLHLADADLLDVAGALGSDVPFLVGALRGRPSAVVSGLGERVEVAPLTRAIHLVLILPGFACPTGAVYQEYDRLAPPTAATSKHADLTRVRGLAGQALLPPDGPFNDLAEPACRVRPELRGLQQRLSQMLHIPVHITGSGSTLFAVAPSAVGAQAIAGRMAALGLAAIATRTL